MATGSQTLSQVVRRSLHLYINDPTSQSSAMALGSSRTATLGHDNNMPEQERSDDAVKSTLFSVLCMYDFSPTEPGLLSFSKNEILDVVKCDNTGWWAAMRRDGPIVGWIPQAYVVRLSDNMAERLRDVPEDIRVYEYEAEQLYNSTPVSQLPRIFDIDSAAPSPLPRSDDGRLSVSNTRHPLPSLHRSLGSSTSLRSSAGRPRPPPSPTSPMPHPPLLLPNGINNPNTPVCPANRTRLDRLVRKQASRDIRLIDSIIHIRPWYLQPQLAYQIEEDSKGHINNATLPALIERLATHDVPVGLAKQAVFTAFTNVFLMTFRTFTTANIFFETLTQRYNARPARRLTEEEITDWKLNWLSPTRKRILDIFSIWLEGHRLLEEEPYLAKPLTDFLATITKPPHKASAEAIVKTLERLTFTVPSDNSIHNTPKKSKKSKGLKSDLLKVDPGEMAEQLTLWEQSLYVKVTPQDCLEYAKVKTGPTVARLVAFCSTYDSLVSWVKGSVLNHEILGKRAYTVDFWIKVAEKCRSLNNIASMSAIISALSSSVLTRLHLTWAHVNRKAALDSLCQYNEPNGGFARYRNILRDIEGPCVPFITMYLNDIVHTQDNFALQDTDGRICFYKRARWYEIVNNILKFTKRPYNISVNETMRHFIETQLQVASKHDSNWFWTKSQEVQHSEIAHADIRKGLEAAGF